MPATDRAGYTPARAARLHQRVDREIAKIEDNWRRLSHLVSDCDAGRFASQMHPDVMLEQFREVGQGLHATIDRRTRGDG